MNTLECPICLDTADKPPIFQCPEGHLICESCSQHLDACPQCGHALMNSRNRTAEELASKLQVLFCGMNIALIERNLQIHFYQTNNSIYFHPNSDATFKMQ